MGFDWMSFAQGFMETTVDTLEKREEEAKGFEERQREAAQRNAATIARRRAVADQVTGYANYLMSNGLSNAQIQATIASGPRAIEELTQRVQSAVRANGGRPLGVSDVNSLISMPDGFTPTDMTMAEYIDQTYGLGTAQAAPVEAEQFSFMDRLFGRDQMAIARQRVGTEAFAEGMTIQQINEAALRGDYTSLIPGTFVSITQSSPYSAADQGNDFANAFARRYAQLQDTPEWITAGREANADEIRQQLKEDMLGGLVDSYYGEFGQSFLVDQEVYIRSILGNDWMDGFIENRVARTSEIGAGDNEDAGANGDTGGDGGTDAGRIPVDAPQPAAMTEAPAMVTPAAAEAPVDAPRAEDVQIPEDANTLPEPPADATVRVSGQEYTYEQWQGMTRTERIAAGLPTSQLGAQFYFNRFAAGIGGMPSIDDIVGPAGEGDPEQTAAYERASNPQEEGMMPVDDTTIALLNSHGGDMFAYLQQSQPQNEEEMFRLLTQWGAENNIVMPFDKGPLIQVFRDMVLPQGQ